ncbi:recombinase family protein [Brucella intermedia]|uniref:recombinase family protein n=1 Tax=Brucella intermedia TaxID=94625 RepID=UPI0031F2EAED
MPPRSKKARNTPRSPDHKLAAEKALSILDRHNLAFPADRKPVSPKDYHDLDHDLAEEGVRSPAMLIGYARVSTRGQDLDQQRAALGAVGCVRLFEEKASGAKRDRPELARMLDHLRAGDVVTVTRLDRLARSTADLLAIAEQIKDAGAGLRSLAEPWADTTTPAGRMVLTVFAGIADFERSLIVERTSAGRIAAKARGVRFGPSPALSAEQIAHARQIIHEDKKPVAEVARLLGVHRATLYRALGSPGSRILDGARTALAIAKGEADPADYVIHTPNKR